jgi:hypothetical protein
LRHKDTLLWGLSLHFAVGSSTVFFCLIFS